MFKTFFSTIPYVNEILSSPKLKPFLERLHPSAVLATVKGVYDDISGEMYSAATERRKPDISDLIEKIVARLQIVEKEVPGLVLDGRGYLLSGDHVDMANSALESMIWAIDENTSISRQEVEPLLCKLTGAEGALFFANPLQARLAVIRTFGYNKKILIARRDLYEDSNGVRLENLFNSFSSRAVEVGAVNHVLLDDYRSACSDYTGIVWMTAGKHANFQPPLEKNEITSLKELSEKYEFPILCEMELAPITNLSTYLLDSPATLSDQLKIGYDLILCSGAQLIGGPNCGIVLGCKKWIDSIKAQIFTGFLAPHRVDLTGLHKTLSLYNNIDEAFRKIPILLTITTSIANLKNRAERLKPQLEACSCLRSVNIREGISFLYDDNSKGQVPTCLLDLEPTETATKMFAHNLAEKKPGLKVRISEKTVQIDLRSISPVFESDLVEVFECYDNVNNKVVT